MNEPRKPSWEATAVYRAGVRGCLLSGAVGDALGHPIEFTSLDRIRATHGRHGVTGYVPGTHGATGLISDDTQMTLFTVEALVQAPERERAKAQAAPGPRCCAGRTSGGWRPGRSRLEGSALRALRLPELGLTFGHPPDQGRSRPTVAR